MQNCGNCKAWREKRSDGSAGGRVGTCHVEPPQAALVPQQGLGGQGLAVVSYRPETQDSDWCGKWSEGGEASSILPS